MSSTLLTGYRNTLKDPSREAHIQVSAKWIEELRWDNRLVCIPPECVPRRWEALILLMVNWPFHAAEVIRDGQERIRLWTLLLQYYYYGKTILLQIKKQGKETT